MRPMLLGLLASAAHAAWEPTQKKSVKSFNEGVAAFNAGELEPSLAALDLALEQEPDCGRCQLLRGHLLLRLNRAEGALAAGRALSRKHRDLPDPHLLVSLAAFAAEDFAAAGKAANRVTELAPDLADGWDQRLLVALRVGDRADGAASLAQLERLLPPGDYACEAAQTHMGWGDVDAAAAHVEACTSPGVRASVVSAIKAERGEGRDDLADVLGDEGTFDAYHRAVEAFNDRDFERALTEGRAALEERPDAPSCRLLVGRTLGALGDEAGALEMLETVLGAQPKVDVTRGGHFVGITTKRNERIYLTEVAASVVVYTRILVARGDVERLRSGLDKLGEQWPELGAVEGAQALLAFLQGDRARAWSLLDRALSAHPDDDSLAEFAGALMARDPDHVTRPALERLQRQGAAISAYNTAVRLLEQGAPGACVRLLDGARMSAKLADPAAQLRVSCASRAGDAGAVAAAVEAAGGVAGLKPAQRYNHALGQHQGGDLEGALVTLAGLALEDDELAGMVNHLRFNALLGLGRLDDALGAAEAPGVPHAGRYNLAVALRDAGRLDDALAAVPVGELDPADLTPSAAALRVELLVKTGDLAGAEAVLEDGHAPPRTWLMVASHHLQAEDTEAALPLLECGCADAVAPDTKDYCADVLPQVREFLDAR